MGTSFKLPKQTYIGGGKNELTLKEILTRLEKAYCNSIGIEFMYINNLEELNFIRKAFEPPGVVKISNEEKKRCLSRLTKAVA